MDLMTLIDFFILLNEHCFNSISFLNTDLRELLPEFYFLPEMLINNNKINFKKKNDEIQIDNVEIPKNINGKNNEDNNINYGYFKFIEYMRNNLEKKIFKYTIG